MDRSNYGMAEESSQCPRASCHSSERPSVCVYLVHEKCKSRNTFRIQPCVICLTFFLKKNVLYIIFLKCAAFSKLPSFKKLHESVTKNLNFSPFTKMAFQSSASCIGSFYMSDGQRYSQVLLCIPHKGPQDYGTALLKDSHFHCKFCICRSYNWAPLLDNLCNRQIDNILIIYIQNEKM